MSRVDLRQALADAVVDLRALADYPGCSEGARAVAQSAVEDATQALANSSQWSLADAEALALAESMKAPQSPDHPWDRGYRAGAAAVWRKIKELQ